MFYFIPVLVVVVTLAVCLVLALNNTSNKPLSDVHNYEHNKNTDNKRNYEKNKPVMNEPEIEYRNSKPNPNNENKFANRQPTINKQNPHFNRWPTREAKYIYTANPPINENNNNYNNNQPPTYKPVSDDKSVLIITLFHSSDYIDSFFTLINNFTYPKSKISIGILEGDSEDFSKTMSKLNEQIEKNKPLYRSIKLVHKNANMNLPNRREMHKQLYRRKKIAELRNYVLKQTLGDENYVLWIDSDVITSPHNDIIELMMSVNKDVVVPNCLLDTSNDARYDANTWILTPEVIEYVKRQRNDYFLMNPYIAFPTTWIKTIYEYRDPSKPLLYEIDVDAVGGTMILAKSKVFRSGIVFPEELYDHCVETEGFGRMVKKNGFQLIGLPNLIIYHAHNR